MKKENEGAWAKQGAFAAAWKYLILVIAMKRVTSATTGLKTGPASRIYTYLRDHHPGQADTPIGTLVSYLKRLEGIKIGPYEAGVKTRQLTALYRLEELQPLLEDFIAVCSQRPVKVFVDELDKGWDASEDAKSFVAGIFQAAISLNELTPFFTVYVSLRQELYDSIPALYDDTQKYRDVIETINWSEPDLLHLIANRIRFNLPPEVRGVDDTNAWSMVFQEALQYRQTKSFNYIVDRTLYRPREIIQFCTTAAEGIQDSERLSAKALGA